MGSDNDSVRKEEIGGYFELESFSGRHYHENVLSFNCARNALLYYIQAKQIKKIAIPYFLCEAVASACERKNIVVVHYSINSDMLPVFDFVLETDTLLYVVNYYGMLKDSDIKSISSRHKNLIIDNVHAFFQKPIDNISTIYSCRKFFGVPDGAYLYSENLIKTDIEKEKVAEKMCYLLGRFECGANMFYEAYKYNESTFANTEIKAISDISRNLLSGINYEEVKQKRTENFCCLNSALESVNSLHLPVLEGAFSYPLLIKGNAEQIRKKMVEKRIYIPTLWPNVLQLPVDTVEYKFASQILPLPCDQRYSVGEMEYMVKMLHEVYNSSQ